MIRRNIGNDQTRAGARMAVEATGIRMRSPKPVHQGNFTSLRNEPSAYLQHMQGGYSNPSIQKARYSLSTLSNNIPNPIPFGGIPNSSNKIFDKTFSKGSSVRKLYKLIK